jgi:hypothetical protein
MHAVMRPRDSSITPASGSPLPPPVPLLPVPDRPRPVSDRCGRARFRSHELGVGQRRRPGQSRHVTADRLLEKCIAVLEDDREHIDHPYQSNWRSSGLCARPSWILRATGVVVRQSQPIVAGQRPAWPMPLDRLGSVCGQAARCGVGMGLGSGWARSGAGTVGSATRGRGRRAGAPGQLDGLWSPAAPGWLVGPLSQ